jgi:hypothetical protein
MAQINFPNKLNAEPGHLVRAGSSGSGGVVMEAYSADVESKMKRLFGWLSEKDRRRYAAVEAAKLGHGGIEYVSRLLCCDPKTIRQGLQDLEGDEDQAAARVRKKGVDADR